PKIDFVYLPSYDLLSEQIPDADVLIGWSIRPDQFAAARKLKWIHSPAAAVHQLMFPELIKSEVVVTNSGDVHGPVVAEHAIALLLALAKRIPQAMQYQRKREWAQEILWQEQPRPREVAGTTALVIGMGSIGREFASRAKALGMKVIALRENPQKGSGSADAVYGPAQLDSVIPEADYILLCTPVTPATTGLMNRTRLGRMKPDAYLINVGRGPLVDEAALIDVLKHHNIAGAALDVFTEEPLPKDSPFWTLENVLITPHTAAVTDRLWERHYQLIGENLRRFLDGKPLLNLIDKRRGY
ncbi:MAG TPA: D-2-hydroxyacid dehydrogenase, partial [Candidatus Angelobacter sp.]|nr:D-2-hydroxyacid dehydrogenase [Candidatus Angelobacter sp.]